MLKVPNPRSPVGAAENLLSAPIGSHYGDYEHVARHHLRSRTSDAALTAPQVWGQFNNYRSAGLKGSLIVHGVLLALIVAGASFGPHVAERVRQREVVALIAPSPDSYTLPSSKTEVSGGGGGGDDDPVPAPKARLPKIAMQQITPPEIVLRNEHPKLPVEATVVVPPQVRLAENHMPNLGIPTLKPILAAPPSNGVGSEGGIGSGSGGGVGLGHGPGVGAGSGGGIGGGVFKVGGGITAPRPLSSPDPVYTEEARQAKIQGTCVLGLIVDANGHPRDVRIVRGLGYGLDAKALEAVREWRFEPARKNGEPVNVQVSVEVAFHLY